MRVEDNQTRKALDYASGTADRNGVVIDMANYEYAKFVVQMHSVAAGATTSVKVQSGTDATVTDAADLEGSGISVAADDDNQVFVIAVTKPLERYLRLVVDKDTTNATSESATVELGGHRVAPALVDVTDEVTTNTLVSPAEGTA